MNVILNLPEQIILKGEYLILKPDITEKEFWELATRIPTLN